MDTASCVRKQEIIYAISNHFIESNLEISQKIPVVILVVSSVAAILIIIGKRFTFATI